MNDLERLLAERACERLIYEYARRIDSGEGAAIAELFTADAIWEGDIRLEGSGEIGAWFARRAALTRRTSRHVCANVVVDVLGPDEAVARCLLVNYRHDRREDDAEAPAPARLPKYMGDIHDRFRRTPDGWRFDERRVTVVFLRATGG